MKKDIVSKYEDLLLIKDVWNDLFIRSETSNLFLTWEWTSLWWKHFGIQSNNEMSILIFSDPDSDQVIGIAPLMIQRRNFQIITGKTLCFLGDDMAADYMDFLVDSKSKHAHEIIKEILDFCLSGGDWSKVELKRFQESSNTTSSLQKLLDNSLHRYRFDVDSVSPQMAIPSEADTYMSTRKGNLRHDIRSSERKLSNLENGKLNFMTTDYDNIETSVDTLVELQRSRQSGKVGTSLFDDTRWNQFIVDLLSSRELGPHVNITSLKLGDSVISSVIGFWYKKVYSWWIPAISTDYHNSISIGKIHIHRLIRKIADCGGGSFDFMIGDELYKTQWATKYDHNYSLILYRGFIIWALDSIGLKIKEKLLETKKGSPILSGIWIRVSKIVRR